MEFDRANALRRIAEEAFDVLVVGGGITGTGVALDAASRGLRTALVAGGLLAFALSFDEIIVTLFTAGTQITLPIWIFGKINRPTEQPVVNVVAMFVMAASLIPVYFAQRLAGGGAGLRREAAPAKGSAGAKEAVAAGELGPG